MKDKTVIILLAAGLILILVVWAAAYNRPSFGQRLGERIDRDAKRATNFFKR